MGSKGSKPTDAAVPAVTAASTGPTKMEKFKSFIGLTRSKPTDAAVTAASTGPTWTDRFKSIGDKIPLKSIATLGVIALGIFLIITYGGPNVESGAKYTGIILGVVAGVAIISYTVTKTSDVPLTFGVKLLYYFLPYALFVFGAVADIISMKTQYFPGSLTALLAVVLNWALSAAMGGDGKADHVKCGIPGLTGFSSNIVPQNMLFNLTALSYIAAYSTHYDMKTKEWSKSSSQSFPIWVLTGVVAIIQSFVLSKDDCFSRYKYGTFATIFLTIAAGTIIGGLVGGLAVPAIVGDVSPSPPSGESQPWGPNFRPGFGPGTNVPIPPRSAIQETCSPESDGTYICETFVDGKKKTTKITE